MSALKRVPKDCDLHIAPLGWQLYGLIFSKSDGTLDFTSFGFAAHQALLSRHGEPLHRAVSMAYTTAEGLCAREFYSFLFNDEEK